MPSELAGVPVEFGVELTVRTPKGRKKRIAEWQDMPPAVWTQLLGIVLRQGIGAPAEQQPGTTERSEG